MYRLLFVCGDNASLSQMAEAFARAFAEADWDVFSAGLRPAELVDDRAVRLMDEVGIDIHKHQTRSLADVSDMMFDVVVTMGERRLDLRLECRAFGHWCCPDPKTLDSARYRDVRHDIGHRVRQLLNVLPTLEFDSPRSARVDLGLN